VDHLLALEVKVEDRGLVGAFCGEGEGRLAGPQARDHDDPRLELGQSLPGLFTVFLLRRMIRESGPSSVSVAIMHGYNLSCIIGVDWVEHWTAGHTGGAVEQRQFGKRIAHSGPARIAAGEPKSLDRVCRR